MSQVIVSGSFDDLRSRQVRFLDEAASFGPVHALLWSDRLVEKLTGSPPKFPQAERQYFIEAIRYVHQATLVDDLDNADHLPDNFSGQGFHWAVLPETDNPAKRAFCLDRGIAYHRISEDALQHFDLRQLSDVGHRAGRNKVVVTGCYDWLHSGHVRFFEEVSQLGDLYVVVGNDANVEFLKGKGHPLFKETERLYMVQAIRYVRDAFVSSGMGWMDAEPQIAYIRPDIYAVNEDGDKPEKRVFCSEHGLEYVVLKRAPKAGLPRRESTHLRGF